MFPTQELEELHHLRYLRQRLESWRDRDVVLSFSGSSSVNDVDKAIQDITEEIFRLEARLGVAHTAPAQTAAATAPPPPPPSPVPVLSPTAAVEAATGPVAAPPRREYVARPPREPFSWTKVGEALLSQRALQTFLYLGAILLVLSAVILVVRLWDDLHWVARQGILLAGMAVLFWAGYQVREKMGLRLSGGALMDIGALWVPLNVGALLFQIMGWEGDATIPGLDIPVGLPMVGWMVIAAVSAPAYAYLAYRFQLVLLVHGAAIAAGVTLGTGMAALGAPLEWQLSAVAMLAPAYVWASGLLRQHDRAELGLHLLVLTQAVVPALFMTVLSLVVTEGASPAALTLVAWSLAALYASSLRFYPHIAFEYLAAAGVPVAAFITLSMHTPIPLAWYNLMLVGAATGYVVTGRYLRRSPLWSRSDDHALSFSGVRVDPLYPVGLAMAVAAVAWPVASVPSATISLYCLVVVFAAGAQVFRLAPLAYLAPALLFAPYALTILWADIGPHWRGFMFAPLAAVYLLAAEYDLSRNEERRLPIMRLLDLLSAPLRSLFAQPLLLAGVASAGVALVFGAVDMIGTATDGTLEFEGAGAVSPWTYLLVAGMFAATAYLRRTSIFVHVAAWVALPFIVVLAERGFYAGWSFDGPRYTLMLGGISLGYLTLGLALDRISGHYSKALYLAGYVLTLVGMFGTIPVKEFNLAMVAMSVAVYGASAYLAHRGGHPAFQWLVSRMYADESRLGYRVTRGAFLYLAVGIFPAVVLLAASFPDPEVAWYGVALASIAVAYLVIAERYPFGDAVYRAPWYWFGLAMSAIGPLVSLADPTLRIAATAVSTARYGTLALVGRRPIWMYPFAALLPVLMVMGMLRADVSQSYFGVALVGLSVFYGVAALIWRPQLEWPSLRANIREVGAFTLPLLVVGVLTTLAGIGLSAFETKALIVSSLATSALFYLLAAVALRQTVLLYPVVVLLAAAYGVGLTLTGADPKYYGLILLPGVVLALAIALVLEGYPDRLRLWAWFLPTPSGTPHPGFRPEFRIDFLAPMVPFAIAAYAGTVAVPALSAGGGWTLFGGLVSTSLIYGYSAWRFMAPLWSYPSLFVAHGAFIRLLFLLSPSISVGDIGGYWIPVVYLLAALGVWTARVKGETAIVSLRSLTRPEVWDLARDWALPFVAFAALGMGFTTVMASTQALTGLLAGVAYSVPLAVGATLLARRSMAWGALAFLALILGQGLRLGGVSLLDTPIYVALAGVAMVVATCAVRRLEAEHEGETGIDSRWSVWNTPVTYASYLAMAAAPFLGLATWLWEGSVGDDLQPLVLTLAITGLGLVGTAYLERRRWLTYLAVAVLELSYMTQLVVFDNGQAQFFIVPAGLFLIAVAYLERQYRDRLPVGVLETTGLALLLGVTLLQSVGLFTDGVDNQVYGFWLFFESLAVIIWGAILRWKRPFFGGIGVFIANLVVLVFDPLADAGGSSTVLWGVFGVIGTALVGGAVYLERNRERTSLAFRQLIDRLDTWD